MKQSWLDGASSIWTIRRHQERLGTGTDAHTRRGETQRGWFMALPIEGRALIILVVT